MKLTIVSYKFEKVGLQSRFQFNGGFTRLNISSDNGFQRSGVA